ncbi:MAG: hypothetical protein QXO16_06855 [Archaeoglobaceae archaeon]
MSEKRAYITILGRSLWALSNAYYAVLVQKSFFPDVVHIFTEEIFLKDLPKAEKAIKVLSEEFGFVPEIQTHISKEAEFFSAGVEVSELIKKLRSEGYRIAIDITPGRKALVVALLIPAMKQKIDHLFYLAVKKLEEKPYMMIPLANQELKDFIEEAEKHAKK